MLTVNDQEFFLRFLEMANRFSPIQRLEPQFLRRKEQNGAGNRRLRNGCLVEIPDRLDLRAGKRTLEGLLAALDPRDKLRYIILCANLLGFNHLSFIIKPADEAHFA